MLIQRFVPVVFLLAMVPGSPAGVVEAQTYQSLIVGVPDEDIFGNYVYDGGEVHAMYGSDTGLSVRGSQYWDQLRVWVAGEDNDAGSALATGDFNGDGVGDLAIGVPGADIEVDTVLQDDAGMIHVLYGDPVAGILQGPEETWDQGVSIAGTPETEDEFGHSLATGDFNGDGYDDLAVGAPGEAIGDYAGAGSVNVIYGSSSGLTGAGDQMWHQDSQGVEDDAEAGDQFGSSLTTGDFDGDGYDDLAIGVRSEEFGGSFEGAVAVLYGSAAGIIADNDDLFTDPSGVDSTDFWGYALASGDFNNDGYDDLAVGAPYESQGDSNEIHDAGAVIVMYGGGSGLSTFAYEEWYQGDGGLNGTPETNDRLGRSLASGDFDGDGYDDLVIGVPHEHISSTSDAGWVNVLYGGLLGLGGVEHWRQGDSSISGTAEENDRFGWAVAAGDLDGDGYDDLVVGAPGETLNEPPDNIVGAGVVQVIHGTSAGLSSTGNQWWMQQDLNLGSGDSSEEYDWFGTTLAVINHPLPTAIFADGFEIGSTSAWSEAVS